LKIPPPSGALRAAKECCNRRSPEPYESLMFSERFITVLR